MSDIEREVLEGIDNPSARAHGGASTHFLMGFCGWDGSTAKFAGTLGRLRDRGLISGRRDFLRDEGCASTRWRLTPAGREAVRP